MTDHNAVTEPGWNFDNSYARLPGLFFSRLQPTPASSPKLVRLNHPLAASLGLNAQALQSGEGAEVFAGSRIPDGAEPLAQAYAGHQFGHLNMLGDGRAALGPMLREYIISEAMHGLGIPTTRSLAVAATGESIYRETELPGAVLTRVAASHLRVGTFQYAAGAGTAEDLRALADYTLQRHFPGADAAENHYLFLLRQVIGRQAALIAKWQLVGFIHGVMNTDNMALSGETIDYGPCAFMDAYDPATVFSSIDSHGRYAYGNQPRIAAWNLARFAETLLPLLDDSEEQAVKLAEAALDDFTKQYYRNWLAGMRAKLGLFGEEPEDETLIEDLLGLMKQYQADYTNTFRALTWDQPEELLLFDTPEFARWRGQWQARLGRQQQAEAEAHQLMRDSNPAVIPRNHRVEEALAAAVNEGDYSVMERLLQALANPYAHSPEQADYAALPRSTRPYQTFCGT